MPRGLLFSLPLFLLGIGTAGFGQTGPDAEENHCGSILPGPVGKRFRLPYD